MSGVEQRYVYMEKEALETTWACERYSNFLIGKTFHIETDHKPLVSLLGQNEADALPVQHITYAGKGLDNCRHVITAPFVESQHPEDKSFQDECQAYVNAVMSALPVTDKRLLKIKQAEDDDATCQNIQEFCIHR